MTTKAAPGRSAPKKEASMLASKQRGKYAWMLVAAVVCLAARIGGQTPEAKISGIITDSAGAVIPGVRVTATNAATGQRTAATTNEQGFYVLTNLPIGGYVVEAEEAGFKKYARQGLLLTTGASVPLDIQLAVGEASDTV